MKIDKSNIRSEDSKLAIQMLNKLRSGQRVFGNPGEFSNYSLKKLSDQNTKSSNSLDDAFKGLKWQNDDEELKKNIAKAKAQKKREIELSEYIEKIIKNDKSLDGIISFASLLFNDKEFIENQEDDKFIYYIPFVLIYGKSCLIIQVVSMMTNTKNPMFVTYAKNELDENIPFNWDICSSFGSTKEKLTDPKYSVEKFCEEYGAEFNNVDGLAMFINRKGALIYKNAEWYESNCKPLHISEFLKFIREWIKDKDNTCCLNDLVQLSKLQVRKEKPEMSYDFSNFGLE